MIRKVRSSDFVIIANFLREFNVYVCSYNELSKNPFDRYLVIERDKKIIGFLCYQEIYEKYELSYIYIKKNYRKKNYGLKLLQHLITCAEKKNIENITLEVCEDNIAAIALYQKLGFQKVAIRQKYYGSKSAYLMLREKG